MDAVGAAGRRGLRQKSRCVRLLVCYIVCVFNLVWLVSFGLVSRQEYYTSIVFGCLFVCACVISD